jgi:hypothetical protein
MGVDEPIAVPAIRMPARPAVARALMWAALAAGIAVNTVEIYQVVDAIRSMLAGSCNAALIGVWFGLPLVPAGPLLYGIGRVMAGPGRSPAHRAGRAGMWLSLAAVPLWMAFAWTLAIAFGLG